MYRGITLGVLCDLATDNYLRLLSLTNIPTPRLFRTEPPRIIQRLFAAEATPKLALAKTSQSTMFARDFSMAATPIVFPSRILHRINVAADSPEVRTWFPLPKKSQLVAVTVADPVVPRPPSGAE